MYTVNDTSWIGKIYSPPLNFIDEDEASIKINLLRNKQIEALKKCSKEKIMVDTDVVFHGLRDNSNHASTLTYLLLDNKTEETFEFQGGGSWPDFIKVEYDGQEKTINCISKYEHKHKGQCKKLPVGVPDAKQSVDAVLLSVDMKPRDGRAMNKQWRRNRYNLTGTYYNISCRGKRMLLLIFSPLIKRQRICHAMKTDIQLKSEFF